MSASTANSPNRSTRSRPVIEQQQAWHRLFLALDEVRYNAAALNLGLEERGELYAPLGLRVDAWLERTRRLLAANFRTMARPPVDLDPWIDNGPAIREWAQVAVAA